MNDRRRALAASAGIVGIFLLVQLGALAVASPLEAGGNQFVEDTSNPTNSLVYVLAILVATVVMLGAFRLGVSRIIRAFVVLSGAYISLFVFRIVFPSVLSVPVGGTSINLLAWGGAIALGIALYAYPEWYVIDAAGILMGIGAAGLFGINFGILPALVLLAVLAVYDAISVYGTEHMLTLASGVMEMRVPIVLVIPLSLSYSFLDSDLPDPESDGEDDTERPDTRPDDAAPAANGSGESDEGLDLDREALFIGLGDAVIPTILVASAGFFLAETPSVPLPGLEVALPAATAMVGTLAGLVVLLWMVLQGRAHAGLPLLNGGAIGGYLVGALASGLSIVEALGLSGLL
ncbi:MAG: presenilin-like A22 family membrane protease [Haloarculaceae archaeon]|jgi:presenilin-like A22 family membrane protease